jgi:glycosyltransferase involved in cell wall biosynthesis
MLQHRIRYIFRKPSLFFSIENVFNLVAEILSARPDLRIDKTVLPRAGLSLSGLWANRKAVRRENADLFHITGDVHYICFFLPAGKTVLTIHDCVFMEQSSGIKRWALKKIFLDWPVSRCRYITTISEKTRRDIMHFTGCAESRIQVIPNPVNTAIPFVDRPFNAERPVILFIGSTPNKNLTRAIEALKGIPCSLHIVGEIPASRKTELESAGIDHVNFLGLTDAEMIERYRQADLVLFPSTYEGFGMPIIEGQTAGRVVVTSNLSPMKEVAGEGAALVDPEDADSIRQAIQKILKDRAYRERLVERGFENIRLYEPGAVAMQYYTLYQKMLKQD